MYNKIPDSIVTISFIPTGLSLGHLFFLPWIHRTLYDEFHIWPYFTILFAIVTSSSLISIIKLSNGKYIFEHFVYLFIASILFIVSGILFVIFNIQYTQLGLFINIIACGVTIVAGLSYINIRAIKHERPTRIAICHLWKILGFSVTFTIYLLIFNSVDESTNIDEKLKIFYQLYGYSIIGSTAVFLLLLMINELLQRQGLLYNYRDCLDNDNNIANNYCKLFSKNEVTIERNTTMATADVWKSTENLNSSAKRNSCYSTLWTLYMLIPKLHGAIIFNYFLLTFSMNTAAKTLPDINNVHGLILWLMILGALIGCIFMRFIHYNKIYLVTSALAIISIGISIMFLGRTQATGLTSCLWVFYITLAIAVSIPDIAILEMSKIRYNEGILAAGYFIEFMTIGALQLWHNNAHIQTNIKKYTDDYYIPFVIASIVVLIVTSIIYMLHVPNTYGMSLLQIQNQLLKQQSYFAFIPNEENENVTIDGGTQNKVFIIDSEDDLNRANGDLHRSNSYVELAISDPLPAINNAKTFDPYSEIQKPPKIIPRAALTKI